MTWIHDAGGNDGIGSTINLSKADGDRHGELFLTIKALAVAAGWTVVGSGDGAAAYEWNGVTGGAGTGDGGAYDVWDTAAEVDNTSAWVVLESPDGDDQLLLLGTNQAGAAWDAYGSVFYAPGGGYSATGIGHSTPPAAISNEQTLRGARLSSGAQLINLTGTATFHVLFDNATHEGKYRFLVLVYNETGKAIHDAWGLMTYANKPTWETAPWFLLGGGSGGAHTGTNPDQMVEIQSQGQNAERVWGDSAFLSTTVYTTSGYAPDGSNDEPVSGDNMYATIPRLRQYGVANEEYGPLVMHEVLVRLHNPGPDAPDYFDHGGMRYIAWRDLAFPIGTTAEALVPAGGTAQDVQVTELYVGSPADATAPAISNITPAASSTIGRTDPITFDITDAGGLRNVLVMVEYPTGEYDMVWDGSTLAQRYRESTRINITNGFRFTVRRVGGWPSSPTFRVEAIDTSGNQIT